MADPLRDQEPDDVDELLRERERLLDEIAEREAEIAELKSLLSDDVGP